ncbi:hypothetical protein HD553DRAFT_354510, partial [Filobasidium floriforme]|uniref:uncharacterized protein n=1 Tax=Filobasidium floriforme TaxID=5210 RepID=UPI001E8DB47D
VRSPTWKSRSDYDLVISYYNEDLETIQNTIEQVKKRLPSQTTSRTIVYAKGPNSASRAAMSEFLQKIDADEIVALKTVGREGETYLQHIVRHYSSTDSPLATHTIFLQPHIPWPGTAFPRLESMTANTGFMSLSTYVNASCPADGSEIDVLDQVHPRIAQIYSSFQQDLCPSTGFTITWFGQFVASRQRIHRNPLKAYQNLLDYFDVPVGEGNEKEWIWDEGWWNNSPDNPTLGHALERSWPAVFGCSDLKLALECKDESGSHCMCMD